MPLEYVPVKLGVGQSHRSTFTATKQTAALQAQRKVVVKVAVAAGLQPEPRRPIPRACKAVIEAAARKLSDIRVMKKSKHVSSATIEKMLCSVYKSVVNNRELRKYTSLS